MRFLADMGISHRTVTFLRGSGHEATHLHDEQLDEMPDYDILDKARSESRVLLTNDLDFGELLAASGATLPSVITFRLRNMTPDNVNRHLGKILLYIMGQHKLVVKFCSPTGEFMLIRFLPEPGEETPDQQ